MARGSSHAVPEPGDLTAYSRPESGSAKEKMRQKLQTDAGRDLYKMRKAGIVELVFGQIKAARGIRGFLLRGIA